MSRTRPSKASAPDIVSSPALHLAIVDGPPGETVAGDVVDGQACVLRDEDPPIQSARNAMRQMAAAPGGISGPAHHVVPAWATDRSPPAKSTAPTPRNQAMAPSPKTAPAVSPKAGTRVASPPRPVSRPSAATGRARVRPISPAMQTDAIQTPPAISLPPPRPSSTACRIFQSSAGQPRDPFRAVQRGEGGPSKLGLGQDVRSADIEPAAPLGNGIGRRDGEVRTVDGVDAVLARPEQPHAPRPRHGEKVLHVGEVVGRGDHGGPDVCPPPQRLHENLLGRHERCVGHRAGVQDMDVGEVRHTGDQCLVQQIAVRATIDVPIVEAVRLAGDAEGRDHQIGPLQHPEKVRGCVASASIKVLAPRRPRPPGVPHQRMNAPAPPTVFRAKMAAEVSGGSGDKTVGMSRLLFGGQRRAVPRAAATIATVTGVQISLSGRDGLAALAIQVRTVSPTTGQKRPAGSGVDTTPPRSRTTRAMTVRSPA